MTLKKIAGLRWTCHVCGDVRPDHRISVYKIDISRASDLPIGTVTKNVRYCNDRVTCFEGAERGQGIP